MKKVFVCIPTLSLAGAEKFVVDLALNLDKEKFEPYVIVTSQLRESSLTRLLKEQDIKIICTGGKEKIVSLINEIKLWNIYRPDIVHANIGSILHILLPTVLYRTPRRIYTFHSSAERYFEKSLIKKLFFLWALKKGNFTAVAISSYVRQTIIDSLLIPENQIKVILNGTDLRRFTKIRHNLKDKQSFTYITVASFSAVKNQKMLIDAFSIVAAKYTGVKLILVGDGELRKDLETQVNLLKLGEKVVFTGRRDDVENFLAKADTFVISSKIEGFSLAALEAMAAGLPVIATKCGGITELIDHEKNGLLVPNNSAAGLARAMELILQNQEMRVVLGENAKEKAKLFGIRECVEQYENLYLE